MGRHGRGRNFVCCYVRVIVFQSASMLIISLYVNTIHSYTYYINKCYVFVRVISPAAVYV